MYEMGIVRKIDNLGRIVFPIEVRNKLGIQIGDSLEIFVDGEQIVFKKYAPGCLFCNSISRIVEYEGKKICDSCLRELKHI
ncbi:AbrB/MazE/SpoVT family DNA-binding domain-containing protein [Aneurinibacillus aneurinilyticus]|uniref:Putative transition state regulator abh n=1 Tax=Aneurinibacillus aneurinilyticus ATCC 12856 TaxID=649747 RepID=U1YFH8_ANEAE|nr:AbrB/MazE/SpoVT family DNA-binding domain-containing protein [Aneurinibacillus aneurinilyticus]ERI10832.1 putative transition state regulator abh [Aneurinibacillus aneurinilyticus ATCC 12856]MED0705920.1 AbrB/MazE/SpoVT family DNA-binding domain-containing protein [Aneurinibacillus aneurinilyticus]MED0722691.1 AbrB/MazE/SpoVT family DNA-binding domain-containing protein [Aneurinibacillus aneurinilyticus]MED0731389.1 AbrB/MazE/SpoVT family DNA-binding domain-containing protein [Aneurinibacill